MLILTFLKTFFNQPEIVGSCELTKLSVSWWHSSADPKPSVREKYSSNDLTTQRLGSCMYVWYETVGGALLFLQFVCSLLKTIFHHFWNTGDRTSFWIVKKYFYKISNNALLIRFILLLMLINNILNISLFIL